MERAAGRRRHRKRLKERLGHAFFVELRLEEVRGGDDVARLGAVAGRRRVESGRWWREARHGGDG